MAKIGIEFPEKMSADPDRLIYIFKLNVRFFFLMDKINKCDRN